MLYIPSLRHHHVLMPREWQRLSDKDSGFRELAPAPSHPATDHAEEHAALGAHSRPVVHVHPIQLERPESCSAGSADDGVPNTDGIGSVRVNGS